MMDQKSPLITKRDLKVVSISLSILSIGFAIAYGGMMLQAGNKNNARKPAALVSPTPTPHQKI